MRIGELSRETGVPVETIRYYEKEGLLEPPMRLQNNYRSYGDRASRKAPLYCSLPETRYES